MSSRQLRDQREECLRSSCHIVIILGVVIFLVVAAALIGGLVGGLKHRHKKTPSGCGSTSAWTFDASGHYNATMGDRSFLVHVPPGYTSQTQYPLVLSFHGYGDNDTWQEHITGLSEPGLQINNQVRFQTRPIGVVLCIDDFVRISSRFTQRELGVLERLWIITHLAEPGKVPLTHL